MIYRPTLLLLLALSAVTLAADIPKGVLRLEGPHAEMGKQHGAQAREAIRLMVSEYIGDQTGLMTGKLTSPSQERITAMKPSLPAWYLEELNACADEAGIDRDVLLYAQCEGDIRSLPGCTTYVAFGQSTGDGAVQMGRSFDYWGITSTTKVVRTFAVLPEKKGHYAFVSVGWTGILGGWTFYNEKGLFVANNLGGFNRKNPQGIPTLILQRIIAETAGDVDEAIAIIKSHPRMRGQALIIGHAGNPAEGIAPSAAVVLYDAERVEVTRAVDGFAVHSSMGADLEALKGAVKREKRKLYRPIKAAGNDITLHSVAIDPPNQTIHVAHGKRPAAQKGKYQDV